MLVRNSLNILRRNCHMLNQFRMSKPSLYMNDLLNTIQIHQKEIVELHTLIADLNRNMDYKVKVLEYKISVAFSINLILVICSMAI